MPNKVLLKEKICAIILLRIFREANEIGEKYGKIRVKWHYTESITRKTERVGVIPIGPDLSENRAARGVATRHFNKTGFMAEPQ